MLALGTLFRREKIIRHIGRGARCKKTVRVGGFFGENNVSGFFVLSQIIAHDQRQR